MSDTLPTPWNEIPPRRGLPLFLSHLREAGITGSVEYEFHYYEHDGLEVQQSPSDSDFRLWNDWLELREQDTDTVYEAIRDLIYDGYVWGDCENQEFMVTLDIDKAEVRVRARREEKSMSEWADEPSCKLDTMSG
jgi:hypothetical protein